MAREITAEQTRNLMSKLLFGTKRDANRTYNNLVWFIQESKKHGKEVNEELLKDGLAFELSSYTKINDDGEKVIFWINKDYSTTDFDAKNFDAGVELLHQHLMEVANWYKDLIK